MGTEELYQRLPPAPSKYRSITIATYPTNVISWANHFVEEEMAVVSEIAKCFRSQKASLGIQPKGRPSSYVQHSDPLWAERLAQLAPHISCLGHVGEVQILCEGDPVPAETLSEVVNEKCVIYIEVTG